jgi:hypothetical protein
MRFVRVLRSTQLALLAGLIVVTLMFDLYPWLWGGLFLLAASHFACNFAFVYYRHRRERKTEDLSEYARHQEMPAGAFAEVLDTAGTNRRFMARVAGQAGSARGLSAPLTGRSCVAWNVEVDLYRASWWAGESSYEPLIERSSAEGMTVDSGEEKVAIDPPCVVDAGNLVERTLSFAKLADLRELSDVVEDAIALAGRKRAKYRGVRVREGIVESGEPVDAYGAISRDRSGYVLRGSDVPESPECLLVRSERRTDKRSFRAGRKGSMALQAIFALALGAMAFLVSPFGPFSIDARDGLAYFSTGGKEYALLVKEFEGEEDGRWLLLRRDNLDAPQLTSGGEDAYFRGDMEIELSSVQTSEFDIAPFQAGYPSGDGATWFLRIVSEAPGGSPGERRGILRLRNASGSHFELKVISKDPKVVYDTSWEFEPEEGMDVEVGLRLTYYKKDLAISEGDMIGLEYSDDAAISVFVAGYDKEIRWVETEGGSGYWLVEADASMLRARLRPLYAENPTPYYVQLTLYNAFGGEIASRQIEPGHGVGVDGGLPVVSNGEPLLMQPGNFVRLLVQRTTVLYSGPLGKCPFARYVDGEWRIQP